MNKQRLRKLHEIYATIPNIACKNLCHKSCGSIAGSRAEFHQIQKTHGELKLVGDRCNFLKDSQCEIYNDRPAICRLYGVTQTMECPHGCEPERWLTRAEGLAIMSKISRLLGETSFVDNCGNEHLRFLAMLK